MVSQIIVVMQKLRRLQNDFSDQMLMVKDFMTKRTIPVPLQLKVRRYLEYQYENRKARNDNPEFMHHLSPWLQLELRECLHKGVLTRHPFFQQLPDKVLKHICGMASSVYYAPNDVVVQRGQRASSMCFIVRGKLCVLAIALDDGQGVTNKILMSPSWIGDMCIFTDMKRTKTVVSVTHSELLVVQKSSVMVLVNEFPKIISSYRTFKAKVDNGDLLACGVVCEYCQDYGHSVGDCPQLQTGMRSSQHIAAKEMRKSGRLQGMYGEDDHRSFRTRSDCDSWRTSSSFATVPSAAFEYDRISSSREGKESFRPVQPMYSNGSRKGLQPATTMPVATGGHWLGTPRSTSSPRHSGMSTMLSDRSNSSIKFVKNISSKTVAMLKVPSLGSRHEANEPVTSISSVKSEDVNAGKNQRHSH